MFLQFHSKNGISHSLFPKTLRAFLCSSFLLLGMPLSAQTQDLARSQWLTGYVLVENAQKAVEIDKNDLGALQMYKEALQIFKSVQKKYPRWNPSLLNYRIDFCTRKIAELEKKTSGMIDKMSPAQLADLARRQARAMQNLSEKIRVLSNNLEVMDSSLKTARQKAAGNSVKEAQLEGTRKELAELGQKNTLLISQIDELEKKLKTVNDQLADSDQGKLVKKLTAYKEQNEELTTQVRTREKEWKRASTELEKLKAEKERLVKNINAESNALKAAEKKNDSEAQTLKDLRAELKKQELAARQATGQVRELEASLKRSNEELYGQKYEIKDLRTYRAKFAHSRDESQKLMEQIIALEKKLKDGQQEISELKNELKKNQDDLSRVRSLHKDIEVLSAGKQNDNRKIESLEKANRQLAVSLQDSTILQKDLQKRVASLTAKIAELENQSSSSASTLDKYEKIAVDATSSEKKALDAAVIAQDKVKKAEKELAACRVNLKNALALEKNTAEKLAVLERQVKLSESRQAEAVQKLEKQTGNARKELSSLNEKYSRLRKNCKDLEKALKDRTEENEKLSGKNAALLKDIASVREKGSKDQDALAALKNKELLSASKNLQKAQKEIRDLQEDLEELKADHRKDLSKAKAKAEKSLRKEFARELKEKEEELEKARRQLVEMNALASRQQSALKEKQQASQDQLVRKLEDTGSRLKKSEEQANLRLFELETQKATVAALNKEVESLKKQLKKAASGEDSSRIERLNQELLLVRNDLKNEQENKARSEARRQSQEKELKKLTRDIASLQKQLKDGGRQDRNYQMAMGSLEVRKTRRQLEESQAKVKELDNALAASREKVLSSLKKSSALQDENSRLQQQLTQLRKMQKDFDSMNDMLKSKEENLEGKDTEMRNQARKLSHANKLLLSKNAELAAVSTELQSMKRKYSELSKNNEVLQQQLTNLAKRSGENTRQSSAVQLKLRQTEEKIQAQNLMISNLEKDLKSKTALAVKLEKAVQNAEAGRNEQENLLEKSNETIALLRADLKLAKSKLAAASDQSKNISENQKNMLALAEELKRTQGDFQVAQSRIRLMTEQIERKDKQIDILAQRGSRKGTDKEKQLLSRVSELSSSLEKEEARRKELEIAIIKLENEKKTVSLERKPQQGPALVSGTAAIDQEQEAAKGELLRKQENEIRDLLKSAFQAEKIRDEKTAAQTYQKVLKMQPDNRLALKRLGMIAVNNGNFEDTAKYLKEAFRLDTDDMDTLHALGYAMTNMEQPAWAVAYLSRATALNPRNSELARAFGDALVQMGWKDAAYQQFNKAYQLNPKEPTAPFNLAVLSATAQPARLDDARKWYKIALQNGADKDPVFEKTLK